MTANIHIRREKRTTLVYIPITTNMKMAQLNGLTTERRALERTVGSYSSM